MVIVFILQLLKFGIAGSDKSLPSEDKTHFELSCKQNLKIVTVSTLTAF
jgi:hypothetical protein